MITTCEYGEELDYEAPITNDQAAMHTPLDKNQPLQRDLSWLTQAKPHNSLPAVPGVPWSLPGSLAGNPTSLREPCAYAWNPHRRQVPFDEKLTTADEALSKVLSGQRVYIGGNCGEPTELMKALMRRANTLRNVEIIHVLTVGLAPYVDPEQAVAFRANVFFIGQNTRAAVNEGLADFTPISLCEIPKLFKGGSLSLDVALISVSPPDVHGFCSYGVEVGLTKPAAENARLVIAEVNPHMPRVWGNSFIHVNQIDYCVPVDYPLPEVPPAESKPVHQRIGDYVASLIGNEATLQMGNGAIPSAVLGSLDDKRNLGIHTEMFSDGIIDLVERGVITGQAKTLLPGKIVGSFVRGTERIYKFVHDNPMIELHPIDFTNDPYVIAQNDNMVAINSALQVDLTGQICADSIGNRLHSGVGGQADFIRGAALSRGGKAIIALPSTALEGEVSRIVSTLEPGAGVTVTRNDVHYVVTEYGIASLFGKTLRQRTEELINVAHPSFRAGLRAAARQRHLL